MKKTVHKNLKPKEIIKDWIIMILVLGAACLLGSIVVRIDGDSYIRLIFVLAVAIISRFTNGYFYGLASSFAGMLAANIIAYPFFRLDFTVAGYPITFAVMFLVSVIISMLTARLKEQNKINSEMEKEKIRANLLKAVSHDIRTPLTSITGAASAMLENYDRLSRDDMINLLTDIKEDSQWLVRMVENILTVTRLDEGMGRLNKTPEAAEEIISEVIVKFRKRYDMQVDVKIPDELMLIPMDALLIEQVLLNLMENSVLHGKNADRISLTLKREGDNAVFSVRDNGAGISEEILPKLFGSYFLHTDEKHAEDGKRNMGIGLSVCMTIVRVHGGEMSAGNLPDGGACFEFTLPITEEKS